MLSHKIDAACNIWKKSSSEDAFCDKLQQWIVCCSIPWGEGKRIPEGPHIPCNLGEDKKFRDKSSQILLNSAKMWQPSTTWIPKHSHRRINNKIGGIAITDRKWLFSVQCRTVSLSPLIRIEQCFHPSFMACTNPQFNAVNSQAKNFDIVFLIKSSWEKAQKRRWDRPNCEWTQL